MASEMCDLRCGIGRAHFIGSITGCWLMQRGAYQFRTNLWGKAESRWLACVLDIVTANFDDLWFDGRPHAEAAPAESRRMFGLRERFMILTAKGGERHGSHCQRL